MQIADLRSLLTHRQNATMPRFYIREVSKMLEISLIFCILSPHRGSDPPKSDSFIKIILKTHE
ncbi:MAG: hypothetical protein B6244_14600 [Candidatus Cloacimonetes bacterium 4572_55]|nr:MAG: hypothetical protein B6244_14600 [Candidatus Cloacimonetes bacterium 4572_55]